ncbi:MAG: YlxR family protein [Desulfobulbaceae bacterium]|nr:YlxR family protein [Desulfobulbaceae bacterium]
MQVGPERTCLGCGAKFGKGGLLRFVVRDGELLVDSSQHLSGRGVYCCRAGVCLRKFVSKKGRLSRALRKEVVDCLAVISVFAESFGD